ncbi:GlxA family transcriptional regulator [Phyllobacterium zundukense]|uniref:Transcriptional regulator n=1 Tax=Phyllobacterium zundukense TaxID=1867719 RepID=A0A2N9VUS5_9HYPH|nr:helix-turn-helix domain-containing protein [Phyllobacterium zundukense]ATU95303.1 transcriptional regulator [Phyllobacterium zundukense]PIO43243.1 transcriptional regulator [Phyllobacterium zundukense]
MRTWEWTDGMAAYSVDGVATASRSNVTDFDEVSTIAILLFPGFSLLSLSSFLAPFEKANAILGRQRFRWTFASSSGVSETCGLGLAMPAPLRFSEVMPKIPLSGNTEMVVMVADGITDNGALSELAGPIRLCIRQNIPIVALGTATWLLAEMGALKNIECTIHWEKMAAFSETFSGPRMTDAIYTTDGGIWSCAGQISAFDLGVALLERNLGSHLTTEICKSNVVQGVRDHTHRQTNWFRWKSSCRSEKLPQAISLMETCLDELLPLERIAATLTISRRQLERLFETYLGTSPHKFYLKLRLDRARQLIESTNTPILEIAVACGFVSSSHFTKCYRVEHGCTPTETRFSRMNRAMMPRMARRRVTSG